MAFFNLTYLGPQDPIKVTCEAPDPTSPNAKKVEATTSSRTSSTNKSEEDRTIDKGESSRARHNGSYVKHTDLMRKHTRNPFGKYRLANSIATPTAFSCEVLLFT